MARALQAGTFVAGGLFIGFWLYVLVISGTFFLTRVDLAGWGLWGFLGLVLTGGFYAARLTSDLLRILIWVALGVALAFLTSAALFEARIEAMAALFTFLGGGLIASGLPTAQPWPVHPAEAAERTD